MLQVTKYARSMWKHYAGWGRSQGDIVKHIVTGKLGEVTFYHQYRHMIASGANQILKKNYPEKGRAYGTDGGKDFVLTDGRKVDVKSIEMGKDRVYVNGDMKSDALVVCLVDVFLRKGKFITFITKEEFEARRQVFKQKGDTFVYYVELNETELKLLNFES